MKTPASRTSKMGELFILICLLLVLALMAHVATTANYTAVRMICEIAAFLTSFRVIAILLLPVFTLKK